MADEAGLPDFTKQIVVFYLSGAPHPIVNGIALEFPIFVRYEGRLFVTGRIAELAGDDWVSSLTTGLAWDAVISYLVFDTREDYNQQDDRGRFDQTLDNEAGCCLEKRGFAQCASGTAGTLSRRNCHYREELSDY